jgi:hypothetical protein
MSIFKFRLLKAFFSFFAPSAHDIISSQFTFDDDMCMIKRILNARFLYQIRVLCLAPPRFSRSSRRFFLSVAWRRLRDQKPVPRPDQKTVSLRFAAVVGQRPLYCAAAQRWSRHPAEMGRADSSGAMHVPHLNRT